jgi:hypothetical protein
MEEKNGFSQKTTDIRRVSWQTKTYCLISWWDMEQFSAIEFYEISALLYVLKDNLAKFPTRSEPLPETTRLAVEKDIFGPVELECRKIGLFNSAETVKEFRDDLHTAIDGIHDITPEKVATRSDEIDRAIRREMKLHLFMHIPIDRAEYYQSWGENKRSERGEDIPLFGNEVKKAFPSSDYDIIEAGNSFAANRGTACVFHLMRVLEVGLTVLAKKFNVSSDHTNWHNIIEQIEAKIRDIRNDPHKPLDWKSEQEFYAKAASHFMFVKDAWRNNAVHGREKYTPEEAKRIMENVCGFMQKIATELSE